MIPALLLSSVPFVGLTTSTEHFQTLASEVGAEKQKSLHALAQRASRSQLRRAFAGANGGCQAAKRAPVAEEPAAP